MDSVSDKIPAEEVLPRKISFYVGAGYSMSPTIRAGDILQIEEAAPENIKEGDIIIYQSLSNPGQNIMHRVIKINKDGSFVTKGDNNTKEDTFFVNDVNLVGKIVEAKRPARIQKYVLYNQYDKDSREFVESLIQQNEQERQNLQTALENAQTALEVSPEYIAYQESSVKDMFDQAILNCEGLVFAGDEIGEDSVKTPEQIALEEAWESLQNSDEYKAYIASEAYNETQRVLVNLQQWEPVRIISDSISTREEFPEVEAFPAVVLDIPELITEGARIQPREKKYCNRVKNLTAMASFEAEHVNEIIRTTGAEKLNISAPGGS
ncbi:MAG: Peptidase S24-like protein [bacterium ADurb.Bin363]|nr:MAG: Peptidase S24-like protein [bacterium ADurb.Bin363]